MTLNTLSVIGIILVLLCVCGCLCCYTDISAFTNRNVPSSNESVKVHPCIHDHAVINIVSQE